MLHYQTETPSAYIKLVDTSTLEVYRPSNPGKALAIIHTLEKQHHNVAIGAFGLKSSNFQGWKISDMDALNGCYAANFAAHLLSENQGWAWGQGYRGITANNLALAAYTTGKLSMEFGGAAYVQTVDYFASSYERSSKS